MRSFKLYHRPETDVLYVRFLNESTGKYGTKHSSGTADPKEAEKIAYKWLLTGQLNKTENCAQRNLIDALKIADLTVNDARIIIEVLKTKNHVPPVVLKSDKANISFIAFLENFWDYDNSPYAKERLRKKQGIHKRYVARESGAIKNLWKPFFKDALLGSITFKREITSLTGSVHLKSQKAQKERIASSKPEPSPSNGHSGMRYSRKT